MPHTGNEKSDTGRFGEGTFTTRLSAKLTSVALRAVSTDDVPVHELDAAAVLGARAGLAVVRGASDRIAIETLRAQLAVAASRVVLADTETCTKHFI